MKKLFSLFVLLFLLTGCLQIKIAGANLPARFSDFGVERDLAYGDESWQKLDVYTPTDTSTKHPVIIFFYGGRWMSGEKGWYLFAAQPFVDRGYVVVVPDYVKYPEGKFPQFMDDAAKVVAWTHKNAGKYTGDKNQLFLMGHSAGGYISLMLATNPKYMHRAGSKKSWIKAVAALAAPHNMDPAKFELDGVFGQYRKEIQVETYLDKSDPPILLLHGLKDDIVDVEQCRMLETAIIKKRGRVQAIYYPDADHRDLIAAMSIPMRGVAPVVDDITKFFGSIK